MLTNILNIHKDLFREGGSKVKTFSVKKEKIVEELTSTINILSEEVLPPLEDINVMIKEKTITDKDLEKCAICKNIVSLYKEFKSPSMFIARLKDILTNIVSNENEILKCIDKTVKSPVMTDRTITAGELAVVDLVKTINLVTTFTSDFLLILAFDMRGGTILNKVFIGKVNGAIPAFGAGILSLEGKKLTDKLNKLPTVPRNKVGEAIVNIIDEGLEGELDNSDKPSVGMLRSMLSTSGAVGIFSGITGGGRSGFIYNPIYHLRMCWADFQMSRYESLKNNKQATEAILLDLRLRKEGSNDPSLDKQIKYYEDKLVSIQYKIDSYEKDFRSE